MASIPLARTHRGISSSHDGLAAFAPYVSRALWAGGIILLVGTAIDLGILWFAQRQDSMQWEFVAITNTVEAFARPVIALALMYAAFYFSESQPLVLLKVLAVFAVALGLAGGLLGVLLATDYLALVRSVAPEAQAVFRSTVFKAGALAATYLVVLVPIGVMGLKKPKTKR